MLDNHLLTIPIHDLASNQIFLDSVYGLKRLKKIGLHYNFSLQNILARYSSLQMIPQSGMVSIILSPLLIILHSSIKEILPYDVQRFDVAKISFGKMFDNYGKGNLPS